MEKLWILLDYIISCTVLKENNYNVNYKWDTTELVQYQCANKYLALFGYYVHTGD